MGSRTGKRQPRLWNWGQRGERQRAHLGSHCTELRGWRAPRLPGAEGRGGGPGSERWGKGRKDTGTGLGTGGGGRRAGEGGGRGGIQTEPQVSGLGTQRLVCALSHLSHVRLFVTPWTIPHQALLSVGFPRQEYWSGWPCSPPGDLPDPEIKPTSPVSPALQADSSPLRLEKGLGSQEAGQQKG